MKAPLSQYQEAIDEIIQSLEQDLNLPTSEILALPEHEAVQKIQTLKILQGVRDTLVDARDLLTSLIPKETTEEAEEPEEPEDVTQNQEEEEDETPTDEKPEEEDETPKEEKTDHTGTFKPIYEEMELAILSFYARSVGHTSGSEVLLDHVSGLDFLPKVHPRVLRTNLSGRITSIKKEGLIEAVKYRVNRLTPKGVEFLRKKGVNLKPEDPEHILADFDESTVDDTTRPKIASYKTPD